MRLYHELADSYPLLTPRVDYRDEALHFAELLRSVLGPGRHSLLELGAGAGHTASWLTDFDLTLTDVSVRMLEHAQRNNPRAVCHVSDMRRLRLNRVFDAVFAHDALGYLLTEADLARALETAWTHLRPGGVLLLVPDYVRETFQPSTDCGGSDGPGASARYLEWVWQREGQVDRYVADYVVAHRIGEGPPLVESDRHEEGLFPRATWEGLVEQRGFELQPVAETEVETGVIFLARRPA
jgi:SAM-dependent methyltransferase